MTSDLLREYPKKCNNSLTDEERWTEIGKAFDEYDEKMIESVKSSIDSLLVFVCDSCGSSFLWLLIFSRLVFSLQY